MYITILDSLRFTVEIDDGMGIKRTMRFGEPFNHENFNFTLQLRDFTSHKDVQTVSKYYFYFNDPNAFALQYKSKVTVTLNDKKGSILTLNSSGFVAQQEADYLNKLMEVYIRLGLEEKNQIADNTVRFIDQQLELMIDSLRRAEQRLQDFRTANRVVDISREGSMLIDRIRSIQQEQGAIELKGYYYSYLKDYLAQRKDLNTIIAPSVLGVDDPQLNALLAEASKAYIDREEPPRIG